VDEDPEVRPTVAQVLHAPAAHLQDSCHTLEQDQDPRRYARQQPQVLAGRESRDGTHAHLPVLDRGNRGARRMPTAEDRRQAFDDQAREVTEEAIVPDRVERRAAAHEEHPPVEQVPGPHAADRQ
jgi:hypothetical protein